MIGNSGQLKDPPYFDITVKVVLRNNNKVASDSHGLGRVSVTRRRNEDWRVDKPAFHPFVWQSLQLVSS